jgi:hypothetical protein
MTESFLGYLEIENSRLEQAIQMLEGRLIPDRILIAALRKQQQAVLNDISRCRSSNLPTTL